MKGKFFTVLVVWMDGKGHPPYVELRGSCAGCGLHLAAALALSSSVAIDTAPRREKPR